MRSNLEVQISTILSSNWGSILDIMGRMLISMWYNDWGLSAWIKDFRYPHRIYHWCEITRLWKPVYKWHMRNYELSEWLVQQTDGVLHNLLSFWMKNNFEVQLSISFSSNWGSIEIVELILISMWSNVCNYRHRPATSDTSTIYK